MPPERTQAQLLARALDGERPADGETAALAALLERAALTARIDVPQEELEKALVGARRRLVDAPKARRRRFRLVAGGLGVATAAAALAAVLVVVSPFSRAPGLDVEARAAEALGGADTVLAVSLRIQPAQPGAFRESARAGWLDPAAGRARWTQTVNGRVLAETLVEPGEVRRYLVASNLLLVGDSCTSFGSACSDLIDPIAFYREALVGGNARVTETTLDGRRSYALVLPVQDLPDAARIEQLVFVDAETYLPLRIVWRDVPEVGPTKPVTQIDVVSLRVVPREEASAAAFTLDVREDARVIRREQAAGAGEARRIDLGAARGLRPPLSWLGGVYDGRALRSIEAVDLGPGFAYRLRYGQITVWNYTNVVPPEVLGARRGQAKPVPIENEIASFYATADGVLVAELERPGRSVAVVAPELAKVDVIDVLEQLRPLR